MAFSLFCILESVLLIMNAFAILNDRFLKKSKSKIILTLYTSWSACWVYEFGCCSRNISAIVTIEPELIRCFIYWSTPRQFKELANIVYIHIQKVHALALNCPKHFLYLAWVTSRLSTLVVSCLNIYTHTWTYKSSYT